MNREYIYALIAFILMFQSCHNRKETNKETNSICQNQKDSIQNDNWNYPEKLWQLDSLGCLGLRRKVSDGSIILHYSLLGKSIKEFCEIFGKPNETYCDTENNRIDLKYYIQAMCDSNVIIMDSDKAWISFTFINDSLLDIPKIIIIE